MTDSANPQIATMSNCAVPTANKDFKYQTLQRDSIRLLRFLPTSTSEDLHLSLEHCPDYFDDAQYFALSYYWGELEFPRTVTLNDTAFHMTENLWNALIDLRH